MDLFNKQYHAPGTMPGTLADINNGSFSLTLVDYSPTSFTEENDLDPLECKAYLDNPSTTWIHIQGTPTPDILNQFADIFGLHSLHLEDVLNTGQRPKLDVIDEKAFVILSLPILSSDNQILVEQVCIFFGERTVISICAGEYNPFALVYERLRQSMGKLRHQDADYLFYTLIDTVIDHGFPVLETYAERIDSIEEILIEKPGENIVNQIHQMRRDLLLIRRRLWPHREVINELLRDDDNQLMHENTRIYLRDCYDHTISILELLETYREMTAGMFELYLSSVSNRLNEVMRVLTIIATLFIPPTFVVGVYGMNFDRDAGALSMPELASPYGYVMVWLVIVGMVVGMLAYFRRQRWF